VAFRRYLLKLLPVIVVTTFKGLQLAHLAAVGAAGATGRRPRRRRGTLSRATALPSPRQHLRARVDAECE
jgi:hypothetical protein